MLYKGSFPPKGFPPQGFPQFAQPPPQLLTRPECDAAVEKLRKAMKGMGTKESSLIEVFGKYTPLQMNQIINGYESHYGNTLLEDIKSETSGNFGKLCCALSMPLVEYDVKCLHDAIAGVGTDEKCLIEILVGRTNSDIKALKEAYQKIYDKELKDDIKGDTSGTNYRLYKALLKGERDESNAPRNAEADADALYKAGEGRMGTDESAFIDILCNYPSAHLRQVFDIYEKKYEHSIEKAISKEFSGDVKKTLTYLVLSIKNKAEYIADLFEKSMKGVGTNDNKLIRLAVRHRSEYVITPIKEAYLNKYGRTLAKRIKGDTSGDYCKLLLACIHENK
jgi:hypothetical protein